MAAPTRKRKRSDKGEAAEGSARTTSSEVISEDPANHSIYDQQPYLRFPGFDLPPVILGTNQSIARALVRQIGSFSGDMRTPTLLSRSRAEAAKRLEHIFYIAKLVMTASKRKVSHLGIGFWAEVKNVSLGPGSLDYDGASAYELKNLVSVYAEARQRYLSREGEVMDWIGNEETVFQLEHARLLSLVDW